MTSVALRWFSQQFFDEYAKRFYVRDEILDAHAAVRARGRARYEQRSIAPRFNESAAMREGLRAQSAHLQPAATAAGLNFTGGLALDKAGIALDASFVYVEENSGSPFAGGLIERVPREGGARTRVAVRPARSFRDRVEPIGPIDDKMPPARMEWNIERRVGFASGRDNPLRCRF